MEERMNVDADSVMEVLDYIERGLISVQKVERDGFPCHAIYKASNGWTIGIFDECSSEFDYLEFIELPDGTKIDFWKYVNPRDLDSQWERCRNYEPSEKALAEIWDLA